MKPFSVRLYTGTGQHHKVGFGAFSVCLFSETALHYRLVSLHDWEFGVRYSSDKLIISAHERWYDIDV